MRKRKKKQEIKNLKKASETIEESEKVSGKELVTVYESKEENSLRARDTVDGVKLSKSERQFIELWVEYKNINLVSAMADIPSSQCMQLLGREEIRKEIDRISRARTQLRFATKIFTLDECQEWLTSAVLDQDVPEAERLSAADKLKAVKLLLDVKILKSRGIDEPEVIDNMPVLEKLDKLSLETVKGLLETSSQNDKSLRESKDMRKQAVAEIPHVTQGEANDISHMSPDEILGLLDALEKKKK